MLRGARNVAWSFLAAALSCANLSGANLTGAYCQYTSLAAGYSC